jgi:hypothetical protein
MTLIIAHFVTSHRGCVGGVGKQLTLFIVVGVDVACQQCTVLSVTMEIRFALLSGCEIIGIVVNNNKSSVL